MEHIKKSTLTKYVMTSLNAAVVSAVVIAAIFLIP